MDMFGPLDLDCPECGARLRVTMADIAAERVKRCSRGHAVHLKDEGRGARSVEKAAKDLEKSIEKLNRTLKF